jgi:hypothetical protein
MMEMSSFAEGEDKGTVPGFDETVGRWST